jgi:hypothetical protein
MWLGRQKHHRDAIYNIRYVPGRTSHRRWR